MPPDQRRSFSFVNRFGGALPLRTLAGIALAIVAVLMTGGLSYRSLEYRSVYAARINHTVAVLERLEAVQSTMKDAETGQRGYLLTGDEIYLDPYAGARATVTGHIAALRELLADSSAQQRRLEVLAQAASAKLDEMARTVELRRAGKGDEALALTRSDVGRVYMERVRQAGREMQAEERSVLADRQAAFQSAERESIYVSTGGAALLLVLVLMGGALMSRDHRSRERATWVRNGQLGLATRLQGEQRLEQLGQNVLEFLGEYVDAQVGAVYMADGSGRFQRVAAYALSADALAQNIVSGQGLLGQAAKQGHALRVRDVPPGYMPVNSSLGQASPRELLLVPATVDGVVQGVLELGFLHQVKDEEQQLLSLVAESLGVAVRASKDRTKLEALLEETQRQAEELQSQQEELRVSNEELEEQGRALKESQVRLEAQHAELEQTNNQLAEQATLLESQKDELIRTQAVVNAKATELASANRYKSEFLANMSHELRTPLNSSLILAKLLSDNKEGNLSAEQIKFAQTIYSAGNDLLALINDILDLSKIEAGKMDVRPEPVSVARLVESLQRTFEPMAREKGLAFKFEVAPGTPEQFETDPQRLAQILKNLLSNALKFTERGEVSLRVQPDGDAALRFVVRDTGIGIPEGQRELIFEAFRQADGSTHRRFGGTGLGLSISRDLARLLGGDVTVTSAPQQGSEFCLVLPRVYQAPAQRGAEAAPAPPAASPAPAAVRTAAPASQAQPQPAAPAPRAVADDRDHLRPDARTILVIEDDIRFAAILRDLVREQHFQCIVTHNAADGLAAAKTLRPSAILLDMNLPDQSGLTVLDQLKREPHTRHLPVHVMSVEDYTQAALELGAVGYALKPVKREQVIEAIARLEAKFSQRMRGVLVVEDDARQRESIRRLLDLDGVQITTADSAGQALQQLRSQTFDCMVMDLNLPDMSGYELLEQMAGNEEMAFPPVIVYTGRSLSRDDEQRLRRYSRSIIIKDARSPERLLDEVTLFLHQVEAELPADSQRMLKQVRNREKVLEGRRILIVEDDVRNIFALSSVLEPRGAKVEIVRNGKEALERLTRGGAPDIDLVLMDVMMPVMDGLTATREMRKLPALAKLPVIALTAKATQGDREECLAAGANDYIAKPLDVERLLSLVRVWMPK